LNSTQIILEFLAFLAEVEGMFRQVHLFAEKIPAFRSVCTMVIPSKAEPSEYADHGVIISIALDAELRKPIDSDKKSLGISLLLRHTRGVWLAEADVGWSGQNIGWDSFDSKEAQAKSIDEIVSMTPSLVDWLDMRFREEVGKFPK
jgi:hypothetical protein